MKDKTFLDTNIFVYSFDSTHKNKQKIAQRLIKNALENHTGIISTQIIQEFFNVAAKKFESPPTYATCKEYLEKIFVPLCEIFPSIILLAEALSIREETKYGFYDSLIISAAIQGNCNILYTEDMQDGQNMRGVKILNPFTVE